MQAPPERRALPKVPIVCLWKLLAEPFPLVGCQRLPGVTGGDTPSCDLSMDFIYVAGGPGMMSVKVGCCLLLGVP